MANLRPRFLLAGRDSQNGLAGYLQKLFSSIGTATVLSGQTSIVVTDALAKTGDLIIASVLTKGTNVCHVSDTSISNGVSFTISVNTDPGTGGAVIAFFRISNQVLFTS